jgi:Tol biopolymer transport system component
MRSRATCCSFAKERCWRSGSTPIGCRPRVALAEQIGQSNPPSLKLFSVSANGVLAYRSGGAMVTQLAWFDRAGKPLDQVGPPATYSTPRLSPDQKRLAVERADPQTLSLDLWLFDLVRGGTPSRFTFDPASEGYPVWSPDGARIAFGSLRDGLMNVYQKLSSGAGEEDPLLKSGEAKYPTDWSPDGRFLLYTTLAGDVWLLPLSGDRKPVSFLWTPFIENWARFSPDGRWISYQSNASGRQEIYVKPFREGSAPGSTGVWQVSTDGGTDPQWRRDGKELFYLAPDRRLMAVEVKAGATFEAGAPRPLFALRTLAVSFVFTVSTPSNYTVSADGQRFLVNSPLEDVAPSPIQVVMNWTSGLKK